MNLAAQFCRTFMPLEQVFWWCKQLYVHCKCDSVGECNVVTAASCACLGPYNIGHWMLSWRVKPCRGWEGSREGWNGVVGQGVTWWGGGQIRPRKGVDLVVALVAATKSYHLHWSTWMHTSNVVAQDWVYPWQQQQVLTLRKGTNIPFPWGDLNMPNSLVGYSGYQQAVPEKCCTGMNEDGLTSPAKYSIRKPSLKRCLIAQLEWVRNSNHIEGLVLLADPPSPCMVTAWSALELAGQRKVGDGRSATRRKGNYFPLPHVAWQHPSRATQICGGEIANANPSGSRICACPKSAQDCTPSELFISEWAYVWVWRTGLDIFLLGFRGCQVIAAFFQFLGILINMLLFHCSVPSIYFLLTSEISWVCKD